MFWLPHSNRNYLHSAPSQKRTHDFGGGWMLPTKSFWKSLARKRFHAAFSKIFLVIPFAQPFTFLVLLVDVFLSKSHTPCAGNMSIYAVDNWRVGSFSRSERAEKAKSKCEAQTFLFWKILWFDNSSGLNPYSGSWKMVEVFCIQVAQQRAHVPVPANPPDSRTSGAALPIELRQYHTAVPSLACHTKFIISFLAIVRELELWLHREHEPSHLDWGIAIRATF